MLILLRRRCLAFRPHWVALLLIALVWQPALRVAGEAHASQHQLSGGQVDAADASTEPHDPQHAHEHRDHGGNDDHRAGHAQEAGAAGDLWHGLMHLGHCCNHAPALPSDALAMPMAEPATHRPTGPPRALRSRNLPQPLRPPIAT